MTRLFPICAAALLLASCAGRKAHLRNATTGEGSALASAGGEGFFGSRPDVLEADIRGKEFRESPSLSPAYFEYDEYALTGAAREALRRNAAYLAEHPYLDVLVEGHCDERGTNEYNLALGQRRAAAVREHYMRLGVPGRAIGTLSLGEERPVCAEPSEACWRLNRRGASKVRLKEEGLSLKSAELAP